MASLNVISLVKVSKIFSPNGDLCLSRNPAFRGLTLSEIVSKLGLSDLHRVRGLSYKQSRPTYSFVGPITYSAWAKFKCNSRYNVFLYRFKQLAEAELQNRDVLAAKQEQFLKIHKYGVNHGMCRRLLQKETGMKVSSDDMTCRCTFSNSCDDCWKCMCECVCVRPGVARATSCKNVRVSRVRCAVCGSMYGDECACDFTEFAEYECGENVRDYTQLPFAYISKLLLKLKDKILELKESRISSDNYSVSYDRDSISIRLNNVYKPCSYPLSEECPVLVPIDECTEAIEDIPPDEDVDYSNAWDEFFGHAPYVHEGPKVLGGMEDASEHGAEGLTFQQASNVLITTENEVTTETPNYNAIRWDKYVTSDKIVSVDELTDRWFCIKQGDWTTDNATGAELFYLQLPEDALTVMNDEVPNVPFLCHTQFNCDMEIKILLNCNAFQVGALQMSWIYLDHIQGNTFENARSNIFSCSQTHHVVATANAQNEATIYIPYLYPFPMLYVKPPVDYDTKRILGTLRVKVLNKLNVAVGGPTKAHYSVMIRFPKCTFSGMRKVTLESQMLPLASIVGQIALRRLERELESNSVNADNPYNPLPPPYIVPRTAHNLSYGKNAEDALMCMRLDPSCPSPHACMPDMNELRVDYLCSIFGLIQQYEWNISDIVGKSFIANGIPVEPFVGLNVQSVDVDAATLVGKKYILPPVAVVSSMFQYWRGCLDFKLDIISSQFHTGKLLVAYVPGVGGPKNITMKQCFSSPHVIIDINAQNSVTFRIPYISSSVWQRRAFTGNATSLSAAAVSRLYIFVFNPCINAQASSDKIYINMYVRASPDFEVSVPAQPSVGLSNNTSFFPVNNVITPIKGDPYYAGTWVNFVSQRCVLRYEYISITEPGVSEWAPPPKPKKNICVIYVVEDPKLAPRWCKDEKAPKWTEADTQPIKAIVLCDVSSPHGLWYAIPCLTEQNARILYHYIYELKTDIKSLEQYLLDATNVKEADVPYSKAGCRWVMKTSKYAGILNTSVQNERDQCVNVMQLGNNLASTGSGSKMFGEKFNDIKDLLRRYQLYASIDVDISYLKNVYECRISIPLCPQGLNLVVAQDKVVHSTFNRCREGPIPIILSGFRFFDGGINIKIVLPEISETVVWVQHRPDNPCHDRKIKLCSNVNSGKDVLNHGFATEVQVCKINPVIELNIPYYLFSTFGLLQQVDSASANVYKFICGLGTLNIGFNSNDNVLPTKKNVHISVFYCLADDFQPLLFYGFPPMLVLDKLPEKIASLTDDFEVVDSAELRKDIKIQNDFQIPKETPKDIMPQGLGDYFKSKLKKYTKEVAEEEIPAAVESFQEVLDEAIAKVQGDSSVQLSVDKYSVLVNVLSQLIHCILNPTPMTIAVAVVTSLYNIGVLAFKSIQQWIEIAKKVVSSYIKTTPSTPQAAVQPTDIRVQNDKEVEEKRVNDIASWVTLIFSSIAALCEFKSKKKPDNWASLVKNFTVSVSSGMKQGNWVHTFIKKTFGVLEYFWHWIMRRSNKEYAWSKMLGYCEEEIAEWMRECAIVTDQCVYDNRQHDPNYHERVYAVKHVGEGLIASMSPEMIAHKNIAPFLKQYDAVTIVYNKLIAAGKSPGVRKLNFTLYVHGAPGIGKSCLSNVIARDLLKSVNFKTPFDLTYVHNPQSQFWDDCRHQPVMIIDDMWHDRTPQTVSLQLMTLFQVCSPVPLCPPKAAVEEKGMRYNPEILIMNSNYNYVYLPNVCDDAVNRRRDVLLWADLIPLDLMTEKNKRTGCGHCVTGKPSDGDASLLEDQHHLQFKWCYNKLQHSPSEESAWMTYDELMVKLVPVFKKQRVLADKMFMRNLLINSELRDKRPEESQRLQTILDVFDNKTDDLSLEERMLIVKQTVIMNQKRERLNMMELLNRDIAPPCVRKLWVDAFNAYMGIRNYYNQTLFKLCAKLKADRFFGKASEDHRMTFMERREARRLADELDENTVIDEVPDIDHDVMIPTPPIPVETVTRHTVQIEVPPNPFEDEHIPFNPEPAPPDEAAAILASIRTAPEVSLITEEERNITIVDEEAAVVHFSVPYGAAHDLDVQNNPSETRQEMERHRHERRMQLERAQQEIIRRNALLTRNPYAPVQMIDDAMAVHFVNREHPPPYTPVYIAPPDNDDHTEILNDVEEIIIPHEDDANPQPVQCATLATLNRMVDKGQIADPVKTRIYNGGEYEMTNSGRDVAQNVLLNIERLCDGIATTFRSFDTTRSLIRSLHSYGMRSGNLCPHMNLDFRKFVCFNRVIMHPDGRTSAMAPCDNNTCPLHLRALYKAWMIEWLYAHPSLLLLLRKRKYACLPLYFQDMTDSANVVRNLYDWLRGCWMDTIKPGAKKLCKFIVYNFLTILYAAVLLATGISVVACACADIACAKKALATNTEVKHKEHTTGKVAQRVTIVDAEGKTYNHDTPKTIDKAHQKHFEPQGITQQAETVCDRIRMNSVMLNVFYKNNWHEMRCLGLRAHSLYVLRHYIDNISAWKLKSETEGWDFKITVKYEYNHKYRCTNENGFPLEYDALVLNCPPCVNKVHTSHLVLVELPRSIPPFKDLTKFIATENDHKYTSGECYFVMGAFRIIQSRYKFVNETDFKEGICVNGREGEDRVEPVKLKQAYSYPIQQNGYCGSVLIDTKLQRPIIGIHVCGSEQFNVGFSEVLFVEDVNKVPVDNFDDVERMVPDWEKISDKMFEKYEGVINPQGLVPKKMEHVQARRTAITKSLVHGTFPVETEPNPLHKFDRRLPEPLDPLHEGVKHHGEVVKDFPHVLVKRAYESVSNFVCTNVKPIMLRENLTMQEAICGVPEISEFESLSWNTSAGYPLQWNKPVGTKGKRWLFQLQETDRGYLCTGIDSRLNEQLGLEMTFRKNNIVPATIFVDCLKDTCLPLEKCRINGKTRIFSISPVQYTIPFRQYVGNFMGSYRRARFNVGHAIGVNVNSSEWGLLVRKLQEKGVNICVGDYKNFGPGLNEQVAKYACKIVCDWYECYFPKSEWKVVRKVLMNELLNALHLCERTVYRVVAGIPSGSPITDVLNSLVNWIYLTMGWMSITKLSFEDYLTNVYTCVYGDDVIFSVNNDFVDIFNSVTLSEWFAKYNVGFTDTDKLSGKIIKCRDISTANFLKRTFVPHPTRQGEYLAQLDIVSVNSACNWIHKSLPPGDATLENCLQAMELAYGHGAEEYKRRFYKLVTACLDVNLSFSCPTWYEVDCRIFDIDRF